MDPITIAALTGFATSALINFVRNAGEEFAGKAGEAAWNALGKIASLTRAKFLKSSPEGTAALESLTAAPTASGKVAELAVRVRAAIESDPEFAAELAKLVRVAQEAGADSIFNTTIHGNVGKLVQIGEIHGDLKF
jgi:hypothetical protein